ATWTYDADAMTVTLSGKGAYLGLAKVYDGGELTSPDLAPASITYPVAMSADGETMTIDIEYNTGQWWHFVFAKQEDRSSVRTIDRNLFKVYPNPAKNEITVSSNEDLSKVTIYDVTGKVMFTSTDVNISSTVNVSAFSRGIYMVEVLTDDKTSVKRLILD
ncbi:MAG: T9SS type A sorting domain-containing protein, partial [Bacteroidia bacterium]|nr:T9SS type A sorting domain-containing protein [Bacteroidia bacterium]